MRLTITGRITELADNDVKGRVGERRYAAIKELDAHPCWVTMVVAKAGESGGTIADGGRPRNMRKRWPAAVIQELADHMNEQNPFRAPDVVVGHDDPTPRGKLVAGWADGDEAHAVGMIADPETQKAIASGDLDTCSLDVTADLRQAADGVWEVEKIGRMNSIALANSRAERPGFRDAAITAVVQETEAAPTLKQVKALIEEQGWRPEQFFGAEALMKSPAVSDAFKAEEKRIKEETEKAQAETVKKLTDEKAALEKELQPVLAAKAQEAVKKLALDSELLKNKPHGLREYVADRISIEIAKIEDKAARQKALDEAIKVEMATVEKYKMQFAPPDPARKDAPVERVPESVAKDDYTKPENNPMIAAGKDE
jgi:hypothetical protein